jgi:iron complex outermembrane receptor protein
MRTIYNFQILHVVFNKHLLSSLVIFLLLTCQLFAQDNGTINGHIKDESTGDALIRVNVIITGTTIGAATDLDGNYTIANVPVGTYSLVFSLIGYQSITMDDIVVIANQSVQLDVELSASVVELGDVTVYAASRKDEKITETPTAVTVIGAEEIKLKSNSIDVPKLLETQPGVDLVQSGVDDYNLNTRGFNSSVTRRVLVLIDGRDLGAAFLGQQEWGAISYPLEDVGNLEFVRGPGSALYGTNAFNGVLSITTFSPQQALGTKVKLSGGELDMFRIDIRNAGLLGAGFSYKINVGYLQSKNWDKNRVTRPFEYPGLSSSTEDTTVEKRTINDESLKRIYGSARLDYQFADGSLITAEGGISIIENNVITTGIGRLNIIEGSRPWGILSYSSEHLYISAWGQARTTPDSIPIYSLSSGDKILENSTLYQIEGQYNDSFFQEKLRVIVGGSQKFGHVDMKETAMEGTRDYTITGGYAQLEYKPIHQLKLVATGRVDRTTYEKARFSPRFAAVWSFLPNHSLRVSFNKAFLYPSISEYFLRVVAGGVDLSSLGINLGEQTPIFALGNTELVPERIDGYEVGYKGIFLENKLFITLDGYYNEVNDFITDLLQGVNPAYPFNGAPAGLSETVKAQLPGLTILPSGETAVVVSYANAGRVNERGLEFSFNYYLTNQFLISGNWSYFDFEVKEQQEGDKLLPNNPKHKFGYSIRYTNPHGFDAEISGRSVQTFDWAAGVFAGRIPEYHLFNLSAGYQITQRYRADLTVTNLFDRQAYQIFGGSIVGRQLIASITATF